MGGKERPRGPPRSGAPVRLQQSERPACGLRLSAVGLAGSTAHPPLRGRPQNAGAPAPSKISRISLKEYRRAAAEQERHPCTARRQPDVLRAGLWASGRPARREAREPAGQPKNAAPQGAQSAGQSATLEIPAHLQRAVRTALAPCDRYRRPRRGSRLGGASRAGGVA